jgi:hypothetical protein
MRHKIDNMLCRTIEVNGEGIKQNDDDIVSVETCQDNDKFNPVSSKYAVMYCTNIINNVIN